MLVLSRKRDQEIVIAGGTLPGGVVVTVLDVRGDKVRLGIEAAKEITIDRREVADAIARDGRRRQTQGGKDE